MFSIKGNWSTFDSTEQYTKAPAELLTFSIQGQKNASQFGWATRLNNLRAINA